MPKVKRVDRKVFEEVIIRLVKTTDGKELVRELSKDAPFYCSILKDISKGKHSSNYEVLKEYTWNNRTIEQFVVDRARSVLSYFSRNELQDDYYRLLNVSTSYSAAELRRNWLELMKAYHPDKIGAEGLDVTKKINEAYEVLSDPIKRRDYEAKRLRVLPLVVEEQGWKETALKRLVRSLVVLIIFHWKSFYSVIKRFKHTENKRLSRPRQSWLKMVVKKEPGTAYRYSSIIRSTV